MNEMFAGASLFDQDISNWNTENAQHVQYVSKCTSFNQDIGKWNVLKLQFWRMFAGATSFNQDLFGTHSSNEMFQMFLNTPTLSNTNKGLIHQSFASNSNWPYDWKNLSYWM